MKWIICPCCEGEGKIPNPELREVTKNFGLVSKSTSSEISDSKIPNKTPKVSKIPKLGYSKTEMNILKMIPKDGSRISLDDLIIGHWPDSIPTSAGIMMYKHLRRLETKILQNKETFTLERIRGNGEHPYTVRIGKAEDSSVSKPKEQEHTSSS
jgi:hypothetical protein